MSSTYRFTMNCHVTYGQDAPTGTVLIRDGEEFRWAFSPDDYENPAWFDTEAEAWDAVFPKGIPTDGEADGNGVWRWRGTDWMWVRVPGEHRGGTVVTKRFSLGVQAK